MKTKFSLLELFFLLAISCLALALLSVKSEWAYKLRSWVVPVTIFAVVMIIHERQRRWSVALAGILGALAAMPLDVAWLFGLPKFYAFPPGIPMWNDVLLNYGLKYGLATALFAGGASAWLTARDRTRND